jgi:hypothetical protein
MNTSIKLVANDKTNGFSSARSEYTDFAPLPSSSSSARDASLRFDSTDSKYLENGIFLDNALNF